MKPEDQRIAIAEACGWNIEVTPHFKILRKPNDPKEGYCCGIHLSDDEVWEAGLTGDENGDFQFPDYLSDLNAMHEAEKTLQDETLKLYVGLLNRVVYREDWIWWWEDEDREPIQSTEWFEVPRKQAFGCISATAPQRAEAFLRTLGLWKEAQGERGK